MLLRKRRHWQPRKTISRVLFAGTVASTATSKKIARTRMTESQMKSNPDLEIVEMVEANRKEFVATATSRDITRMNVSRRSLIPTKAKTKEGICAVQVV